jgi:hypothetical protein
MYRILDVQVTPCTQEAAKTHAALTGLPGEREVKTARMKFLRGLLDGGRFGSPSWARGRCLADGVMYRLDGQHSSHMLAELDDAEMPRGLMIQQATWEFDTLAEAANLFNLFNNPRSVRSNEDVMGIYQAAVGPALQGYSRKFLVAAGKAIHARESDKWDNDEPALGPFGPREHGLYFQFPAAVEAARWLSQFRGTKHQSWLSTAVIAAEMLRQWETDPALATVFWTYVFTESHPDPKHETRLLADIYHDYHQHGRKPQYKAKALKAWKEFVKNPVAPVPPTPFVPAVSDPPDPDAISF